MNKKIYNALLVAGSVLVLVSSVLVMEKIAWGKYTFAVGTAFYILSRLQMKYTGDRIELKRLNRYIYISSGLLLAISYLQFTGNNIWIALLLIAALSELFCTYRVAWYEKNP